MPDFIASIIDRVLLAEGGYVNDPADNGGETNFGITAAVARANGYSGPMSALPRSVAINIYTKKYVEAPGFARIALRSQTTAAELVDTGVNMGPAVASRFLQRSLNLLTDAELAVDGELGNKSFTAFDRYVAIRGNEGIKRLNALLNAFQGTRYAELAEGRKANRKFIYGWLARIVE